MANLQAVPQSLPQLALALGGVRGEVDARALEPMRPTSGRAPPADPAWLYELKLDGFRLLADARGRDVVLRYRSGHDCTQAFPEVVAAVRRLRAARLLLDGEVVAWDEQGRPDFDRLAPRLRRSREPKPPVAYHVFDVLAVGKVDVRTVPLLQRKRLVERIVTASSGSLRAVPHVVGDGRGIAAFVAEHELEGFVAKRVSSTYCPGPSSSWVKVKRRAEEDFVVTRVRRDREGRIDALAVAAVDGGRLRAHGVVELGAWRVNKALPPFPSSKRPGWTEPFRDLLVTITFTGRTGAGRLREPVVKGVRTMA